MPGMRYPHLIAAAVRDATPAPRGSHVMFALCFLSELALYAIGSVCLVDLVGRVAGWAWWAWSLPS